MVGTTVVGWYSASYKLIVVLLFVPIVLNCSYLPCDVKFLCYIEGVTSACL